MTTASHRNFLAAAEFERCDVCSAFVCKPRNAAEYNKGCTRSNCELYRPPNTKEINTMVHIWKPTDPARDIALAEARDSLDLYVCVTSVGLSIEEAFDASL